MNTTINNDALSALKTLENKSIDTIVTSPPYWMLRNYNVENQLGQETTFKEYIEKLIAIFNEAKRVLNDYGSCWVNMGDVYSTQSGMCVENVGKTDYETTYLNNRMTGQVLLKSKELKRKTLCCLPFRFATQMVDNGWILRNTIIWHKGNPMPSSARDRFTNDFEYFFFFTKKDKYYFDQQLEETKNNKYRNMRTTWHINTFPFKKAHFACFPPKLIEVPILSTCPEKVCIECGQPVKKKYETKYKGGSVFGGKYKGQKKIQGRLPLSYTERVFTGYDTCSCEKGFRKGIVLDMFAGAFTTALVAKQLNRDSIMIELNKEYIKIGKDRI